MAEGRQSVDFLVGQAVEAIVDEDAIITHIPRQNDALRLGFHHVVSREGMESAMAAVVLSFFMGGISAGVRARWKGSGRWGFHPSNLLHPVPANSAVLAQKCANIVKQRNKCAMSAN